MTVDHEHGHSHEHGHEHGHAHGDPENPWAGQGSVLLDIGGDVGALIVEMPAELTGVEVEIRPAGSGSDSGQHHPHVAVVARPVGSVLVPSLVYPELHEGCYELYEKGTDNVEMTARVEGGVVTETTWPAATPEGVDAGPSSDRAGDG